MSTKQEIIKRQIIDALSHPEAEQGLYFDNLYVQHETDERPIVCGNQVEILEALKELIAEGRVYTDESGEEVIFFVHQEQ
jgi:hypothetical protein